MTTGGGDDDITSPFPSVHKNEPLTQTSFTWRRHVANLPMFLDYSRDHQMTCVSVTVFPIISAYYFSISQALEGLRVQTGPEPSGLWVDAADGCQQAADNCHVTLSLTFISTGTPQNWDIWLFLKWRSQNCLTHLSSLNCSCFSDWVWMQHRFRIPVFVVPSFGCLQIYLVSFYCIFTEIWRDVGTVLEKPQGRSV